jgi:hypothetical protein
MNSIWIKTDDLLPPLNIEVLAYRNGQIAIGMRIELKGDKFSYKFAGTSDGISRFKFSHYMPLPDPPEPVPCAHDWPENEGGTDINGVCTKCGMSFMAHVHMECP